MREEEEERIQRSNVSVQPRNRQNTSKGSVVLVLPPQARQKCESEIPNFLADAHDRHVTSETGQL